MELVIRQEKTLDGLRSRLYDTLDNVILGKIKGDQVECICVISEQIINSAKLEVDTMLRLQADKRIEAEKTLEASKKLESVIDSIEVITHEA